MAQPNSLSITPRLSIPLAELELSFVRSGGPGGQNVNKVASKAVLRFDLSGSSSLPEPARERALQRLAGRLTKKGELILTCDVHRDQGRNREAVVERFRALLADAVRPAKKRRPTKPTAASKERRLAAKKARARRKRERSRLGD
jgi:ribosome-associated protein